MAHDVLDCSRSTLARRAVGRHRPDRPGSLVRDRMASADHEDDRCEGEAARGLELSRYVYASASATAREVIRSASRKAAARSGVKRTVGTATFSAPMNLP